MQSPPIPSRGRIETVVPAIAGWRSYRRAWVNLLIFGVAVLAGTWIVHQTEYTIEYGRRFSSVMATSPHRFYMAPGGIALALALAVFLILSGSVLGLSRMRLGRLLLHLPPRLTRHVDLGRSAVSWRAVGWTTLVLTLAQSAVYFLQENLEYLATVGTLPGFGVLLAPQHATVVPLHFIAAVCSSLLLWTVAAWLGRARRALGMARVLLDLATRGDSIPPRRFPPHCYLPSLRNTAGIVCLRSPPRHA
jgi:hypothetical protein